MGEVNSEKALGDALQAARQAAGLTQQELCQKAGISYSTLAKIERGAIKTPSVFTVQKIANVLGLSIDEILGAVVNTETKGISGKRTSKAGISFLYLDINGCLVRFYHEAFTKLGAETGIPGDLVESAFWHYNDAACRGEITMEEFNQRLSERLGTPTFEWMDYYMDTVEPIQEMHELLVWASKNFKVGLLSNIMPGFVDTMIKRGILPSVKYDAIVDSSKVGAIKPEQRIYEIAQQYSGVTPGEILFVDDSRTNLMAADRMGWRVLWFDDYRPQDSADKIRTVLEL